MIQDRGQGEPTAALEPSPIGFRFGVFELDLDAGELRKDGRLIRIRNQPLRVLALLLTRPGAVVTREDLHKELWHPDEIVDFDQGLNHSIREIRAILGDDADSPRFIQTLPRRGYRFLAEVRPLAPGPALSAPPVGEPSPSGPAATARPAPGEGLAAIPHSGPRVGSESGRWAAPILVAILLAIIAAALSAWPPEAASDVQAVSRPQPPRLLVLPFAAASRSADDELIADGLTDEIIARVGRANPGGLTVLGHTSSRELKGRTTPLRELRRALDVAYVVEGRVQRTPQGLRAIASLVRTEDGARLWTLDDERHEDLWAFQDSVSARVARGIDGAVLLRAAVLKRSPRSLEANLSYLRGRALLVKRDSTSLRAALRAFEECVANEPTFAPAWASMAETRIILMDHGLTDPSESWPEVKVAVDRSITLDPDLAEGWHVLATYLSLTGARDGEARKAWERALTLNPNLVVAHHWAAVALAGAGRNKEAEAAIRRAIALDPLAPVLRGNLGDILSSQGRNAEALHEFQIVLDLRPDWSFGHVWMGQALSREGRWAEAVKSFERGASVADGAARAHLVVALARSGNPEKARTVLAQLTGSGQPYVAPYYRALASFSVGDRDAAIADLRLTIAERSPLARRIRDTEEWKGFETDPRFQRLVQLASTH